MLLAGFWVFCPHTQAGDKPERFITMSTTTSTQASGLLDILLPAFFRDTGIRVKVLAKGTGAALRDGMDGNADIVFVHARDREEEFVKKGFGAKRYPVMHNDFVLLGPKSDPAGIKNCTDVIEALRKISQTSSMFVSRGDDSGTHHKEQELWKASGVELDDRTFTQRHAGEKTQRKTFEPAGRFYISIGQGMGKTLTFADEKQAYTLADRSTYLNYRFGKKPAIDLEVLCQGDPRMHNPYGIIPVNPRKHPHVKHKLADEFARWLTKTQTKAIIAGYKIHQTQLFYPD